MVEAIPPPTSIGDPTTVRTAAPRRTGRPVLRAIVSIGLAVAVLASATGAGVLLASAASAGHLAAAGWAVAG